jgi:hypothetical protein
MFLDDNDNGVMYDEVQLLLGVGSTVDGGCHKAHTNAAGAAFIDQLSVHRAVSIG